MRLSDHLAVAWHDRAERAAAELRQAENAPALWKPERVARLQDELAEALQWRAFWSLEAVR